MSIWRASLRISLVTSYIYLIVNKSREMAKTNKESYEQVMCVYPKSDIIPKMCCLVQSE